MSTKMSQVVGKPFGKKVREEFNRRKGLEQNFSNTSELYQPYFKIRRLNSLNPTTQKTMDLTDFYKGRFSSLGKIFTDEDVNFTFGMNDIESGSRELRGFPSINSVTFELEDFTFYRTTINFEIPDVSHFKEFKDTWLQFGAPVVMEWGRFSPVDYENQNEDFLPNKEVRSGNIVRFDYNLEGGGRSVTGTLVIYSVTWLPVLQEGSQEDQEVSEFKDLMIEYLHDYIENPDKLSPIDLELRRYFWGVHKEGFNKRSTFGFSSSVAFGIEQRIQTDELMGLENSRVIKRINHNYDNVQTIEEFINCHFSLDSEMFGMKSYYFISFELIEKILNDYYSYLSNQSNIDDETIFKFNLSDIPINNYELSGIRSRAPDQVLINPYDYTYRFDEDRNDYVYDAGGNIFLSRDIFISAPMFFNILDQVRGGYSFVSKLTSDVKMATSTMVDLEAKREDGEIINGNIITSGISLIDSSVIIDDQTTNYTTFKLHHAQEKLNNVGFSTEISDEIANMIFFRSRGDNLSNQSGYEEQFLFSKQLNMKHVKNILIDSIGKKVDWINKIDRKEAEHVPEINHPHAYRSLRSDIEERDRLRDELSTSGMIEYNEVHDEWVVKGFNDDDYKLEEFYTMRNNLMRKIQLRFDNLYSDISRRVADNINSRTLQGDTSKSDILNILTFIQYYFSHTLDLKSKQYYTKHNFKMPYNLSFEVDGISGIVPSQAFKVDLSAFPIDYNENKEALFVVTGLSHTFDGNGWVTTINGSFWIDFKKQTFLNSYIKNNLSELLTVDYMNTMASLTMIFAEKVKKDLQNYVELSNFLTNINFESEIESLLNSNIINLIR